MENNAATASQRCFFPPAGGRKKNNADRRLASLATTLLTTKSGSRMPNWIALTRLTGADEYGKRSIVAMMGNRKRRSGCRRRSFFFGGASSPPLLLRCQTPQERSRVRRVRAQRHALHAEKETDTGRLRNALFFPFFLLLLPSCAVASSSAWGGGSESSLPLAMPQKKKDDKGRKRCYFPSCDAAKRKSPVPSRSTSLLLDRFSALPERDAGSERRFVSRK